MSHWNYRVVRSGRGENICYSIHEVYYNSRGGITMLSEAPIHAFGSVIEELREDLKTMNVAFEKPTLIMEDIQFEAPDTI